MGKEFIKLFTPLKREKVIKLKAGEKVLITGVIYTARDAAHKKLVRLIKEKKSLPFLLDDQIIYYTAPTPPGKGKVIGACGPTTSSRMDKYTPLLLSQGLRGVMGKGQRSVEVKEAIKKNEAIYFITIGGAGAYLSRRVKKAEIIAFPEIEPEAIYKLWVEDFPAIVGIDARGEDLYQNLWRKK